MQPVNYADKPGLYEAITKAGHFLKINDGVALASNGPAVQAIIDSYDPTPYVKQNKIEAIAEERYRREQAGFIFQGFRIKTDDRSKMMLAAAAQRASRKSDFTTSWKGDNGVFAALTAIQVQKAFDSVADFVNALFQNEESLTDQINAATTVEEVNAIDITTGWPQ